jgi:hypothetical protein
VCVGDDPEGRAARPRPLRDGVALLPAGADLVLPGYGPGARCPTRVTVASTESTRLEGGAGMKGYGARKGERWYARGR